MDATVAAALTSSLNTFKADALTQLGDVLPVAITVTVSVAVLFFGIRLFRAITHI